MLHEMDICHYSSNRRKNFEEIQKEYQKLAIEADVFGFSDSLQEKVAKLILRSQEAEPERYLNSARIGLPAFFIPYPHAAANHQEFNAKISNG